MISNPRIGQSVLVHYAKKARHARPLHGKTGVVVVVSRGGRGIQTNLIQHITIGCREKKTGPRNHGVLIDGVMYVIPCGNLNPAPE